jgi:hypothetical protein
VPRARSVITTAPAIVADGIGVALVLLGFWAMTHDLSRPIEPFDEGILLTNARDLLVGRVAFRDFYLNYPPGAYQAVTALWTVVGVSVTSARIFGLTSQLVAALLAGRLAGRSIGCGFSWLTAGLVLLWLGGLGGAPLPWHAGLTMTLLFAELFLGALHSGRPLLWLGSGIAWTAISYLRHDLFIFLTVSLTGLVGLTLLISGPAAPIRTIRRQHVTLFATGALLPVALLWAPTLYRAGVYRVVADLFVEQIRVQRARLLPMPSFWALHASPGSHVPLPVILTSQLDAAVALSLAGPLLTALGFAIALRIRLVDKLALAVLGAICLAVLPQMLGRTDELHAISTVAPALTVVGVLVEGVARARSPSLVGMSVVLGVALACLLPLRDSFGHDRLLVLPTVLPEDDPSRRELVAWIRSHTAPHERIFVGTYQHRRVSMNEAALYYLTDRIGATRYTHFDPNLVNRLDTQREMVAELEKTGTRVVILSSCCVRDEPNESSRVGSSFFDEYVQRHYRVAKQIGPYLILLRATPSQS